EMTGHTDQAELDLKALLGEEVLSDPVVPPAVNTNAFFDDLQAQISAEKRTVRGWLRSRPTGLRGILAFVAFAVVVVVAGPLLPRADWAEYPAFRMVLHLGSVGVLLALSLLAALRPLHRPALSTATVFCLGALSVLCTLVLSLLPEVHTTSAMTGPALPCFLYGVGVALPVFVFLRLLDRGPGLSVILAACAAGLAGNMALQMQCPVNGSLHQLLGHVTPVAALGVLAFLWSRRPGP
ncbi:MAG: hypothetical protein KC416_09540, partial [Myxococcales bacterium]|nr:hypothetical protein [Myxococcales bacterium]